MMTGGRTSGPAVGKIYEFTVVPFALEFSLNADIGAICYIVRETAAL